MVTLHVAGEQVGTLADAVRVIGESLEQGHPVEFRDAAGEVVGRFIPLRRPSPPDQPWYVGGNAGP